MGTEGIAMMMTTFAQCKAGRHHECPRIYPDPGFGGAFCDCDCHSSRQPPPLPDPRATGDLEYWLEIHGRSDPAPFEAYLRHYPEGTFAEDAKERLAKLKPGS